MRLLTPILLLIALMLGALWWDHAPPRGDVVFANSAETFTLDPQRLSYQHDVRTARALFEGLTQIDGVTGEVVPAAAESWERSEDGRTWTFHLRPDLRWSDGSPLTSKDFAFAWQRALLPDLAADYAGYPMNIRGARAFFAWRAKALESFAKGPRGQVAADALWKETTQRFAEDVGLRTPDDRTLVVELERPVAYWLDLCAFPAMFPVPQKLVQRFGTIDPGTGMVRRDAGWTKGGVLVGNGPFRLTAWRPNRSMRFERNPHYRDAAHVPSASIESLPIEDANTAVLAFENGAVDWVTDTLVEYRGDMFEQVRAGTRDNLHVLDAFGTDFFSFNCRPNLSDGRPNPFSAAGVRRAFALAVDKQALVDRITRLGERVATTLVPPGAFANYRSPTGLPFDPARAQREMAEAGWTMRDGALRNAQGEAFPTVEIMYSANSPRYRDMASAMADMWQRALGVQCSVRSRDQHGFKDALKRGDFMIARGGWYGDYGDPTTWLDLARSDDGNNDRRYANPDYDALLDRAAMELDPSKRFALLEQAETMLVERDLPMLPICHYVTVYMYDPARLQGISRHPRLEQYVGRLGLVPTAP